MTTTAKDYPALPFATAAAFEEWMRANHDRTDGVWVKLAKKASGIQSVTHDEALDIALCFGWIDGQRNGLDDTHFLQKFTPRRPRSLWSKRNIDKVEKLIETGRMQDAGLAEIEAAKLDGRWDAAYESQQNMTLPADFAEALARNTQARDFYETLNKTNRFAIAWRLATARTPATRQRRFDSLMAMLERGEKPH